MKTIESNRPGARRLRPGTGKSGMALALVIVVVALLTIIVFDRFNDAWIESALAASYRNETKAYYAARAGQTAARLILADDSRKYDALNEPWAQPSIPLPVEHEYVFITIVDEGGKINLNSLTSDKGYPQERMIAIFRRLLENLDLDSNLADAVIDWTDPNSAPLASGAEGAYYQSLEPPYAVKNSRFDSVDELYFVKDFTPEVIAKIKPHITVWSSGKININTATRLVLLSLDESMTAELADNIIRFRAERPFMKTTDIKKAPGMEDLYPNIALDIDTKSDHFFVTSTATFDETTRTIVSVYHRPSARLNVVYHKIL